MFLIGQGVPARVRQFKRGLSIEFGRRHTSKIERYPHIFLYSEVSLVFSMEQKCTLCILRAPENRCTPPRPIVARIRSQSRRSSAQGTDYRSSVQGTDARRHTFYMSRTINGVSNCVSKLGSTSSSQYCCVPQCFIFRVTSIA